MRTRTLGILLSAAVVPLVLTACSGDSEKSSAATARPEVPAPATNGSAGSPASHAPSAGIDLAVAKRPASDRQVISTAQLDLQARNIDAAVTRATALVVDAGGYVFSESASLTSAQHAHVVFKVPPGRFADVLARAGRLGTLVHRQIGTQDVTGQVVDLGARLQAAQTSAERLRQLLANSAGVSDLLDVENQLTQREGQVDSLAGELGALRARIDMATITLDVSPTAQKAVAQPRAAGPGFMRGLRAGSRAFAGTARIVEAAAGIVLPFLPLVLLALAGWWVARRRKPASTP
jgi:hypothetical protein